MEEFKIRKVTAKKIFIRDDYISLAKSFMSLPIFNAVNKKDDSIYLDIEIRSLFQYQNVRIKTPLLSLNFDFNIFLYYIKEAIVREQPEIFISFESIFKFLNVSRENFPLYKTKTLDTFEKLKMFSMRFVKNEKEYLLGLVSDVVKNDEGLMISVSKGLKVFYEADHDLIFNLEVKKFNKLNSAFARALYLFYKSNNFTAVNTFKIEDLMYRLQCRETQPTKEINRSIRKAHKELIERKLIVFAKEIKNGKKLEKFAIQITPVSDNKKTAATAATDDQSVATSVKTTGVESAWLDTSSLNFESEEDELPF
ncbi:hypothetical protein [Pseudomonas sp. S3_A09]